MPARLEPVLAQQRAGAQQAGEQQRAKGQQAGPPQAGEQQAGAPQRAGGLKAGEERAGAAGWLAPVLGLTLGLTLLRIAVLAASPTDLFVDEAQYWLWGRDFAFGYYSKPPMLAWAIGLSTSAGASDAPFWVRLPAPVFHAGAALALAALAADLHGRAAAIWTAAAYLTLPMVAAGSLLIGADAMMAPFYAAALWFYARAARAARAEGTGGAGGTGWAAAAGLMLGAAFLGKYAALYFLPGALLAALRPEWRIRPAQALAMAAAFALVAAPNLFWNLANGLATIEHTADNTGWARAGFGLHPGRALEFLAGQVLMFGPILLGALVWMTARRGTPGRGLLPFVLPPIAIVTGQALVSHAYPNWAATAYLAGVVAVAAALMAHPRWLGRALAVNAAMSVALAAVALFPGLTLGREAPVAARYLGRADLSRAIIAAAEAAGHVPVVSDRRDVLADLFHTGRDTGLAFYAPRPEGRPANHYEQRYPLARGLAGRVLAVATHAPVCGGAPAAPLLVPDTAGGAYDGSGIALYLIAAECADAVFRS